MITQAHYNKVTGYIKIGMEEGANLVAGGLERPANLPEHLKMVSLFNQQYLLMLITVCVLPKKKYLDQSYVC